MKAVIHKCPGCNASLVPITRILTDGRWETQKISAERAMHLNKDNYYYWKCPGCNYLITGSSEILAKFIYSGTYARLERALRKKRR